MSPTYTELARLENELSSLIVQKAQIEKKMIELKKQISELKVTLSNSRRVDDTILDRPTPVVPEVPRHLRCNCMNSIQSIIISNYMGYLYYPKSSDHSILVGILGEQLSRIGREFVLYKTDIEYSKEEQKETEDIIKTCGIVSGLLYQGDMQGYNKYISFFDSKFGIPANPFVCGSEPYDFFLSDNDSIFRNVFYLSYYLNYFKYKIKKNGDTDFLFDSKINEVFTNFLKILHELRKAHYGIGILPILNKDILNRSAKDAQNIDNYISFLFDRNYVDIPTLVDSSISNSQIEYGQFKTGTSYVIGHFRRGHIRNGSWVNGGFVKGHFRRS